MKAVERRRVYRYLLVLPDGEPADPAAFVSSEPPPRWSVGDTFTAAGRSFRIVAIEPPVPAYPPAWARQFDAVWTVSAV
jgi:hypothetical protein